MKLVRNPLPYCAVLFFLVLVGTAWGGGPTLDWITRGKPVKHMADVPSSIGVDNSGNVFVAGTMAGNGDHARYVTWKYLPDGAARWTRRTDAFRSTRARALAVDASGNVVVTGESNGQFLTIKYDADGNEVWTRRYRSGTDYVDGAVAVAVRSDGSVYVAGNSTPPGGTSDFLVVKYDSDGTVSWTARYNGPAGKADELGAMAVDNLGNVCVAGKSQDADGGYALLTVKFDAYGEFFWADRYDGDAGGLDEASAIAVDADRNVYVAGTSAGVAGTDALVMKFSNYGERLWAARYDGPSHGDDGALGVALGPLGEIYVAGWSHDAATADDLLALRYDPDGTLLWEFRHDGTAHGDDRAAGVAVDPYGKLVVTGSSAAGNGEGADIVVLGLDTDGGSLWTRRITAGEGSTSRPTGLALAGSTRMLLTGPSTRADGSVDTLNAGYKQSPLWEGIPFNATDPYELAVALDGAGNPHVCYIDVPEGNDRLLRYARYDGTRWLKHIVEPSDVDELVMAVDSLDRVYIAYLLNSRLKVAFFDGTEWSVSTLAENAGAIALAVDSSNRPHISFRTRESDGFYSLRYAIHDGAAWNTEVVVGGASGFSGTSMALTSSGKAHIAVSTGQVLHWITNMSGAWESSRIDDGSSASIALDASERPHVVYNRRGTEVTEYARYTGEKWIIGELVEVLHLPVDNRQWARLYSDGAGGLHVALVPRDLDSQPIVHAYRTSAGWACDLVGENNHGYSLACAGKKTALARIERSSEEDATRTLLVARRTR